MSSKTGETAETAETAENPEKVLLCKDLLVTRACLQIFNIVNVYKYAIISIIFIITIIAIYISSWIMFISLKRDTKGELFNDDESLVYILVLSMTSTFEFAYCFDLIENERPKDWQPNKISVLLSGNPKTKFDYTPYAIGYCILLLKMIPCFIYMQIARLYLQPLSDFEIRFAFWLCIFIEWIIGILVLFAIALYYVGIGLSIVFKHCCILPMQAIRNEYALRYRHV